MHDKHAISTSFQTHTVFRVAVDTYGLIITSLVLIICHVPQMMLFNDAGFHMR
jgi:hypothetical protein